MKTRRVWLAVGVAALSTTVPTHSSTADTKRSLEAFDAAARSSRCGAALLPATASAMASARIQVAENHLHGAAGVGTGGEGGEGDDKAKADADANLEPMVRFYRDIQLVRGHLLVGDELVQAGKWTDALPHFLHPVEELYDKLTPQLASLKQKPFLQALKSLAQTVKAKNKAAYATALTALLARLDAVDTAVKAAKPDWMPFAVETALETMRSAVGEYGESIEGGKFTKAVEYQDSRGFVWQSERLLGSVTDAIAAKDSGAAAKMRSGLDTLKQAWPAVIPPQTPVNDSAQVASAVSRIELALGSVR